MPLSSFLGAEGREKKPWTFGPDWGSAQTSWALPEPRGNFSSMAWASSTDDMLRMKKPPRYPRRSQLPLVESCRQGVAAACPRTSFNHLGFSWSEHRGNMLDLAIA